MRNTTAITLKEWNDHIPSKNPTENPSPEHFKLAYKVGNNNSTEKIDKFYKDDNIYANKFQPKKINLNQKNIGKNVLQHPQNSVLYLVNNLIKRGRSLYAGDIVLTGSISTTCWPVVGDKVEANIDMLNSVSFNVISI